MAEGAAPAPWRRALPALVAAAAVAVLAVAALSWPYRLREPDPYAYRAATWTIEQGELTLDDAGYIAVDSALIASGDGWTRQLVDPNPQYVAAAGPGGCPQRRGSFTGPIFGEPPPIGITQWVRLDDGTCVSEKSPGYPFLLAPFDSLGLVRLAPLLFGLVGFVGIWTGARRWLGPWGACTAVGLTAAGPGVIVMAHRAWMPTFTDALLLAGGVGFVLWAVLAVERRFAHRAWVGALGCALAGLSTTLRLTNAVPAVVLAVWAVVVGSRRRARAGPRLIACWLAGALVPASALVAYNLWVFGAPWASGYEAGGGGPQWDVGSIGPNVSAMTGRLTWALPVWWLALLAALVAGALALGRRSLAPPADCGRPEASGAGDGAVLALLGAWWLSVWGLYAMFGWTVTNVPAGSHPMISSRFYLPAVGAVGLLAAWLLVRLPAWVGVVAIAALLVVSVTAAGAALDGDWLFSDDLARDVPSSSSSVPPAPSVPGQPPGPVGQTPGQPPGPVPGQAPGQGAGQGPGPP
ncbi:MAG: hypothetical protein R2690_09650 [Acidimicrobiales bacterium]